MGSGQYTATNTSAEFSRQDPVASGWDAIHKATDAETVRHLVSRIFRYDVLQRSQETLEKDE